MATHPDIPINDTHTHPPGVFSLPPRVALSSRETWTKTGHRAESLPSRDAGAVIDREMFRARTSVLIGAFCRQGLPFFASDRARCLQSLLIVFARREGRFFVSVCFSRLSVSCTLLQGVVSTSQSILPVKHVPSE